MNIETNNINTCWTIFYVKDQKQSALFYEQVFNKKPDLDVPGMTEFKLGDKVSLGLMPEAGIKRILGEALPDPAQASGIPRAELYLSMTDANNYHQRALRAGARELSHLQDRSWGEKAAYSLDPDGHVLAFGQPI